MKDEDLTLPCSYDEGYRRIDIKEETGWCYECELDCPLAEKRKGDDILVFDPRKSFKPVAITDKQAASVDALTNSFIELCDEIKKHIPEGSKLTELAYYHLQEAKFWVVEAICKEDKE